MGLCWCHQCQGELVYLSVLHSRIQLNAISRSLSHPTMHTLYCCLSGKDFKKFCLENKQFYTVFRKWLKNRAYELFKDSVSKLVKICPLKILKFKNLLIKSISLYLTQSIPIKGKVYSNFTLKLKRIKRNVFSTTMLMAVCKMNCWQWIRMVKSVEFHCGSRGGLGQVSGLWRVVWLATPQNVTFRVIRHICRATAHFNVWKEKK